MKTLSWIGVLAFVLQATASLSHASTPEKLAPTDENSSSSVASNENEYPDVLISFVNEFGHKRNVKFSRSCLEESPYFKSLLPESHSAQPIQLSLSDGRIDEAPFLIGLSYLCGQPTDADAIHHHLGSLLELNQKFQFGPVEGEMLKLITINPIGEPQSFKNYLFLRQCSVEDLTSLLISVEQMRRQTGATNRAIYAQMKENIYFFFRLELVRDPSQKESILYESTEARAIHDELSTLFSKLAALKQGDAEAFGGYTKFQQMNAEQLVREAEAEIFEKKRLEEAEKAKLAARLDQQNESEADLVFQSLSENLKEAVHQFEGEEFNPTFRVPAHLYKKIIDKLVIAYPAYNFAQSSHEGRMDTRTALQACNDGGCCLHPKDETVSACPDCRTNTPSCLASTIASVAAYGTYIPKATLGTGFAILGGVGCLACFCCECNFDSDCCWNISQKYGAVVDYAFCNCNAESQIYQTCHQKIYNCLTSNTREIEVKLKSAPIRMTMPSN